ncbi:MAG TPA: hypothetical protein VN370_13950 [Desulfitobacteriaceae bacterium]|nr:hypothetical protein [Desulfitobacteriaceae bacterium]
MTIWDLTGGSQIDTLIGPVYEQPIADVAYSPDGKYLLWRTDSISNYII